jgi:aspartyl-tRNA(Asn)/glutamyl-tRNA(Gln) amidotransferase subunit A
MARSVTDIAALLAALAGFDGEDPGSVDRPVDAYEDALALEPLGLRIGLPTDFYFQEVDDEIVASVREAASVFETLGCEVADVEMLRAQEAEDATRRIIWAEALAIHEDRLAAQPDWYGEDVRRRLPSGEQVHGTDYARCLQFGREWRRYLEGVFEHVDVLLTPATGVVAPLAAESEMIATTRVLTRLTYGWSLAGLPALAVPCGFSRERLPIGMQLAARPWAEASLLKLGAAYQRATNWHLQVPSPEGAAAELEV